MVIHTCLTKTPKEKLWQTNSFTTLAFNFLPSLRWVCFYFGAARGKLSGWKHIIAEKFICCWYWEIISLAFLGMFNLGINHEGNSQFTTAGDLIPKFMLSPLSLGRVVLCTFSGLFNRGYEIDMPIDKISIWYFGLFNWQFHWDRLSHWNRKLATAKEDEFDLKPRQ